MSMVDIVLACAQSGGRHACNVFRAGSYRTGRVWAGDGAGDGSSCHANGWHCAREYVFRSPRAV